MSLIADALKKAQSAKLGRRYRTPDPSGVLPGAKEGWRDTGQAFFGSIFSRIRLSPALWIGLGSGIFLFGVLFTYFFYGRTSTVKPERSALLSPIENKPAGLILTPPPSVPAVEPLVLGKGALAAKGGKEQAPVEKAPPPEKTAEQRETVKSAMPKDERKAVEKSQARETSRRSESSKVAVTPDLSEEVRYRFNLALFYQEEKNFPLARREYEKVVQMWPLYAEAHNNLGVVYKEIGMYEQAIAELKKALALNPRYPRAYHNLGVIHQIKGDWQQATKNYEKALSLDRNHLSSYNNLGLVYRSQKRPHEAREILEKALAIDPYFSQTHYNLALVLEETGEIERARFHYQKFVESAGEDNSRLAERVRAYLKGAIGEK